MPDWHFKITRHGKVVYQGKVTFEDCLVFVASALLGQIVGTYFLK